MNFYSYIAAKMGGGTKAGRSTTSLLRLTTLGVALNLAAMLISIAIILGFRYQIKDYAYSQTGRLSLYAYGAQWDGTTQPTSVSDSLLHFLEHQPKVSRVSPIIQQVGLLKTPQDFAGALLYGVDERFDATYYQRNLSEGRLPSLQPSKTEELLLPSRVARRLGYQIGDKVRIYYVGNKIRVRAYELVGIYHSEVEQAPALCRLAHLQGLNHWSRDQYSRVLIGLPPTTDSQEVLPQLISSLQTATALMGDNTYSLNTAEELSPVLFGWLDLLDSNVYLLIVLMLLVGGFSMITGIIIVVLDKAKQIGILKAIGATEGQIRKIFLFIAGRLILRGLLWGNAIALLVCLVQYYLKPIRLNPQNYFMDAVPIAFDPLIWGAINLLAFVLILLMTAGPTKIISSIRPAESMRID